MKIYTITDIFEDDYGCEGIPAGEKLQDIVCLKDDNDITLQIKIADLELTEKNINQGDRVYFDSRGELFKEEIIKE